MQESQENDELHEKWIVMVGDGRPRVDVMPKQEEKMASTMCGDRLLARLIEVHGEPRYDLAPEL